MYKDKKHAQNTMASESTMFLIALYLVALGALGMKASDTNKTLKFSIFYPLIFILQVIIISTIA